MSDKFAILGMLKDADLYGYEIAKRLKDLEGFWYISQGNLYKALNSLEKEGMIEAVRKEEHQGKIRKIYRVTEDGRRAFSEWISLPATPPRTRHEAFLKIWFARNDREKVKLQFEQIRDFSLKILSMLDHVPELPEDSYLEWILDSGRKHVNLDLEWSQECLIRISEQEKEV